jgi:pimeloyl-ACP methyl ester carboxylesterase
MPFASNRGLRIHYTVEGSGPPVVLVHGLLMDGGSWTQGGIAGALSDSFRVACIDLLGHGLSDKPPDPVNYGQKEQAGDVVAVIDDLGCRRAHLVGYSSGGWLSVGVAKHHKERLSSLVVGGWDVVNGLPRGLRFEAFMDFAGRTAPALAAWVSPEWEPGVRSSFDALSQLDGARGALLTDGLPVMLWAGRDDPYHAPMQAFAAADGLPFLSTAGDHLGAVLRPGAETAEGIRAFLERA